jgi:hypothetical protein
MEVEVLADDHLTLLPSTAPGLAGFLQVRREGRQSLRLQFDQPRTDQPRTPPFEFQISFLVQDAVGVGRPTAPLVEIQDASTTRRYFAVTIDPALEATEFQVSHAEPLPATQFRSEWGGSAPAPQSAHRIMGDGFAWSAQTRIREYPVSGHADCDILFRREEARVLYKAAVEFGKGHRLMLRLAAPEDLRIERIAVRESGLDRVDHWSRTESGEILVFLNGRVASACELEIAGKIPVPARREVELPQIALEDFGELTATYRIYRSPDVSVKVSRIEGMTPDEEALIGSHVASRGRLEAVLQDSSPATASRATVEIIPNRPRITRRRLVTSLIPGASQWSVAIDLQLQVNQGVVDLVRFDLPMEVTGPFTTDPPARCELRTEGRRGRQLLIIRPEAPLTGAVRLQASGQLRPLTGDEIRAPSIEPLDLGEMPQFLALPREWQSRSLDWEVSGMRAEPIPGAEAADGDELGTISYRVVNKPRYSAVVRRSEHVVGDPRTRLLEVEALLQSADRYFAVAIFALEPAGLSQCIFELPPGARLVHADLDGRAVSATPLDNRRYAYDLERARLPVQLSISYSGELAPGSQGGGRLQAPSLLDIPIEKTLWRVAAASPGLPVALVGDAEVPPPGPDLVRLDALSAVLASTAAQGEYSKDALEQWRGPWARRWLDAYSRLSQWAGISGDEATLARLEEANVAVIDRYDLASALVKNEEGRAAGRHGNWPGGAAVHAVLDGPANSVKIHAASQEAAPSQRAYAAAAALVAACCLAVAFRRVSISEWLARFAPLLLVAGGVAWWIWLQPGMAGAAACAAGVWLALSGHRWRSAAQKTYFTASAMRS